MNLTESKLFTIEALNRIEGFVWPEGALTAAFDFNDSLITFYSDTPKKYDTVFNGGYMIGLSKNVSTNHPDWRNSLITKEEFDSVDGWVRNVAWLMPDFVNTSKIDYVDMKGFLWVDADATTILWGEPSNSDNVSDWRYHKPKEEKGMPEQEGESQSIERLYDEYQTARSNLLDLKNQTECLQGVVDSLLDKIKSWHKERGFDVSEVNQASIKEVRDNAPEGATHYDGEYGGRYLKRTGEGWMMHLKWDWIKCDPDEQVLSRLMII